MQLLGDKLNYFFPQTTVATSLNVVVRLYVDKINKKVDFNTRKGCQSRTRAADPQNRPIFRLEQTSSCHIPFERKFSAESHFHIRKRQINLESRTCTVNQVNFLPF